MITEFHTIRQNYKEELKTIRSLIALQVLAGNFYSSIAYTEQSNSS